MFVYIASPYSHPDPSIQRDRYLKVLHYTRKLLRESRHLTPFSPIVYGHQFAEMGDAGDAASWWEFNKTMLLRADLVILYRIEGWESSKGVMQELDFAFEHSIPVFSVDPV